MISDHNSVPYFHIWALPACLSLITLERYLYITLHTWAILVYHSTHMSDTCISLYTHERYLYITLHTWAILVYHATHMSGTIVSRHNSSLQYYYYTSSLTWRTPAIEWCFISTSMTYSPDTHAYPSFVFLCTSSSGMMRLVAVINLQSTPPFTEFSIHVWERHAHTNYRSNNSKNNMFLILPRPATLPRLIIIDDTYYKVWKRNTTWLKCEVISQWSRDLH